MGLFVEEASVWRRMCESVKRNRLDYNEEGGEMRVVNSFFDKIE